MTYDPNKYAGNLKDELKWIAYDLDGHLAEYIYPKPGIGRPIPEALVDIDQWVEKGYKIVIHTARGWEDYINIEMWLNDHHIPFKAIICGKVLAHAYSDDKAIKPYWVKT